MSQLFKRTLQFRQLSGFNSAFRSISTGAKQRRNDDERTYSSNSKLYGAVGIATVTCFGLYKLSEENRKRVVYAASNNASIGGFRSDLPNYTLDQVSAHDSKENGVWIVYKQGVYDITNFITKHPGGDKILLAAGSSVEPFWMIYGIHQDEKILQMMEQMRIGNISQEESTIAVSNMSDPYSSDPRRHPVLKPASMKPFNAEPVPSLLVDCYLTPNDVFYVRNHLPVPVVDPASYELDIEIEGKQKVVTLTLEQLKKFPKHTVTATIMCAGNRRSEMTKVKPVKGLSWGFAAVGNAQWSGPRLRDILVSLGVNEDEVKFKHVQFEGLDTDPTNAPYGSSIPFHKAMDRHGDVILAYEMNGEPLPRDHGYPVRVVVPGTVGARNVKWLGRIIVSSCESEAFWQQNDYKGFSPNVDWDTVDFKQSPAIQQLPVISAICVPQAGDTVTIQDGCVVVKGYAWSGGGQKIVRVDVTADGGKNWHVAEIDMQDDADAPKHWSWTLWTAKIPVTANTKNVEIWAKAVDSAYNTQPERFENIWNLRGVLSNAYHRVSVNIKTARKI
ncbi:shopper [Carabus blaptoides fortunei]